MFEWWEKLLVVLLAPAAIMALVGVVVLPLYLAYDLLHPSPTITLSKSQWECTGTYTHLVFTGKIWVNRTDCAQYSLKETK